MRQIVYSLECDSGDPGEEIYIVEVYEFISLCTNSHTQIWAIQSAKESIETSMIIPGQISEMVKEKTEQCF